MSNIFKVNNKGTRIISVASIINFKRISYFSVIIDEFEQINAEWAWETIVSDNKFVFRNYEKYIVPWA